MIPLLRAGALALSTLAVVGTAVAQDATSVQRFRLNEAIPESGITACLSQEVPIEVNTLLAEGHEDKAALAFRRAITEGKCINAAGVVTYTKQVHRLNGEDGSIWTVYEASAGRAKFFVPMHGYLHEDRMI